MANDKEVIKKLLKIAENQQKIITKLAQGLGEAPEMPTPEPMGGSSLGWDDVTDLVTQKLQAIPAAKGYQVASADFAVSDGGIRGKLIHPKNDTKFYEVLKALKTALLGQTAKASSGKTVTVTKDPAGISFIGMTA